MHYGHALLRPEDSWLSKLDVVAVLQHLWGLEELRSLRRQQSSEALL